MDFISPHPPQKTADLLESFLSGKGNKIFARIDQAAEAAAVGLELRPTILLLFGNPKAGTPLMQRYPNLALDLPLKVLIWEENGQVHVIPFGQIQHVTNFSRDWTTVKFNLAFDLNTDIELLRKTVKKIGLELIVSVAGQRRNIMLPPSLAAFTPTAARFEEGALEVSFDGVR